MGREPGARLLEDLSYVKATWLWPALLGFWLLLCGRCDIQTVVAGAASSTAVVFISCHLCPSLSDAPGAGYRRLFLGAHFIFRFFLELLKANLEMAWLILHPRLPISLQVVRFRSKLRNPLSRIILANTITLTPGTLTLDVVGDEFIVHAVSERAARSVAGWIMHDLLVEIEETGRTSCGVQ